ncbi:hypothetical protein FACS189419_01560 [Planctomycetales bacterium]|nr:hypothetical protein FACS189419_01560 [Planctomycetales bacterium]
MANNIYLELELFLDPAIINPAELEKELKTKIIPEWNKKVNANPKYKAFTEKANKYVSNGLLPLGLTQCALNARNEKLAELDHAVKVFEQDGILEENEFKQLLAKFPCFREETIKSRLHLPVSEGFKMPEKPAGLNEEGTSLAEMENIVSDLKMIEDGKYNDFYALLSMSRTSTTKALCEAAKEASEKNRRITKKTAEVDAKNRVLGKAQTLFKDDASRKKYDVALRRRPFDDLCLKTFDLRAAGKSITIQEYETSIEEAQQCGYNAAEAEWMVYDYYINKKKCVPPKLNIQRKAVQQCAACFHISDIKAKVCCHCGTPLKIVCPKCGSESTFGTGYCRQCGFAVGDMPNAVSAVKSAKQCLAEGKTEEAKAFSRKALFYWRDYAEALDLRRRIEIAEKEEIERLKKERIEKEKRQLETAALENKIRELIAKKRFYEAGKELARLKAVEPESAVLQNEGRQIEDTLKTVRNELTKLPNCKTIQEKIDVCEGIIEKTIDCYEAKQALENFPPPSPEYLTVKELPASFQLSWTPPQSKRIPQFVIVRKQGGVPATPQDGEQLAVNLDASIFTDSAAAVGTIYGYAVYSQRGEQFDALGCKTKLLQLVGEVQNLQAMPNDSSVTLTWTPFDNAAVKVFRYTGNSLGGNAQEIYAQKPGTLRDGGLTNGQVYTYKVLAVFKSPDGNDIVSSGKIVSCKPALPPPWVSDLKAEAQPDGAVFFRWTPPARGAVKLFVTKETNLPPPGSVLQTSVTELMQRFGRPIELTDNESANWYNKEAGYVSVIPVTFENELAVFGKPEPVVKINDVKNLHLWNSGTQWHLRWDWSGGIDRVLLVYRSDKNPEGEDDSDSVRLVISRSQYEKDDAVSLPAGQNYYFAVYALLEKDGKIYTSRGMRRQTVKTVIRYSLSFRRTTDGEPEGVLQITAENADSLPALIVKKMPERMPLYRNEGIQIASVAANSRKSGSVLIPKKHFEEDSFLRLFVKDTEEAVRYLIKDPPEAQSELFQR